LSDIVGDNSNSFESIFVENFAVDIGDNYDFSEAKTYSITATDSSGNSSYDTVKVVANAPKYSTTNNTKSDIDKDTFNSTEKV
jgi:hypothetical protein